jgi:hypothetical protein
LEVNEKGCQREVPNDCWLGWKRGSHIDLQRLEALPKPDRGEGPFVAHTEGCQANFKFARKFGLRTAFVKHTVA